MRAISAKDTTTGADRGRLQLRSWESPGRTRSGGPMRISIVPALLGSQSACNRSLGLSFAAFCLLSALIMLSIWLACQLGGKLLCKTSRAATLALAKPICPQTRVDHPPAPVAEAWTRDTRRSGCRSYWACTAAATTAISSLALMGRQQVALDASSCISLVYNSARLPERLDPTALGQHHQWPARLVHCVRLEPAAVASKPLHH